MTITSHLQRVLVSICSHCFCYYYYYFFYKGAQVFYIFTLNLFCHYDLAGHSIIISQKSGEKE